MAKETMLAARRTEEQSVQPAGDKPNVALSIESQVANPPMCVQDSMASGADLNMLEAPSTEKPAKDTILDKIGGEVAQEAQLEQLAILLSREEAFNCEVYAL
eukprot:6672202-Alexandrium_andersonii.AAC.1